MWASELSNLRNIAVFGVMLLLSSGESATAQAQDGGILGRIEARLEAIETQLKRIQRSAFYAQVEGLCGGSCNDAATKRCVQWGYSKGEATVTRDNDRFFHVVCYN